MAYGYVKDIGCFTLRVCVCVCVFRLLFLNLWISEISWWHMVMLKILAVYSMYFLFANILSWSIIVSLFHISSLFCYKFWLLVYYSIIIRSIVQTFKFYVLCSRGALIGCFLFLSCIVEQNADDQSDTLRPAMALLKMLHF